MASVFVPAKGFKRTRKGVLPTHPQGLFLGVQHPASTAAPHKLDAERTAFAFQTEAPPCTAGRAPTQFLIDKVVLVAHPQHKVAPAVQLRRGGANSGCKVFLAVLAWVQHSKRGNQVGSGRLFSGRWCLRVVRCRGVQLTSTRSTGVQAINNTAAASD